MKELKKLTSLLLVLAMVLSLGIAAFAAEGDKIGKITITNALPGEEYKIYRIADLESYDKEGGHYTYKLNANWTSIMDWKDKDGKYVIKDVYLEYDSTNTYVVWAKTPSNDDDWRAFAKLCKEYAEQKGIQPTATNTAEANTTTVEFTQLDLGYYLVDSSAGLVCSLNTTDPEANIEEKNIVPNVTKQVKEDSDGYGTENDADIGQEIEFHSDIKIRDTNNVIFHDAMGEGLDFVYNYATEWNNSGTKPANKNDYMVLTFYNETDGVAKGTTLVENTHYTVTKGALTGHTCECDFHITFAESIYNAMKANPKKIWHVGITYYGKLNEKARIGKTEGNINKCHVTYGDKNTVSNQPQTVTYTYEFKVFKYTTGAGNVKNGLDETVFTLKLNSSGEAAEIAEGNEIQLIVVNDGKTDPNNHTEAVYRVATPEEIADASIVKVTDIITNKSGKFVIKGLDASSYLLTEKTAHEGYNKLDQPATITISKDGTISSAKDGYYEIENKSGSELPRTGGIGTTIFYVVGSILLVGAAVLLITKKRMSSAE